MLKISGITRATYYFYINKQDENLKNQDTNEIEKIKKIFYANKKRYGYRKIALELKNQGMNINHKEVLKIRKIPKELLFEKKAKLVTGLRNSD